MFWHKWPRGTICDNINGPGGPFMSNINGPSAGTIYVVTEQRAIPSVTETDEGTVETKGFSVEG